jgi:hypothetical protein
MVRKTSTINNHTLYFQKWQDFCLSHRIPFFSAPPLAVAAFLFEAAVGDHTASPTLNRCGAISFFCHMAGTPDPMTHPLCKQIKSALQRKLGVLGTKKTPLMYNQIIHILHERLTSTCEFDTLMTGFHIVTMYEGCLRWHDLHQILFGDIIITPTFLRLFIQSAKTDTYREGQWVTIAASDDPFSACQILQKVLHKIVQYWTNSSISSRSHIISSLPRLKDSSLVDPYSRLLPIQDIPITFAFDKISRLPDFSITISYPTFLKRLREWCVHTGSDPLDIGTHSLRRGLSSDWTLQGIPDRLRREHGRWRSDTVADGYIDASINIQLLLQNMQH